MQRIKYRYYVCTKCAYKIEIYNVFNLQNLYVFYLYVVIFKFSYNCDIRINIWIRYAVKSLNYLFATYYPKSWVCCKTCFVSVFCATLTPNIGVICNFLDCWHTISLWSSTSLLLNKYDKSPHGVMVAIK